MADVEYIKMNLIKQYNMFKFCLYEFTVHLCADGIISSFYFLQCQLAMNYSFHLGKKCFSVKT